MKQRLGIIVPYRDREEHLNIFIPYMFHFLKKHCSSDFNLFIINQHDSEPFNRGKLINVGYERVKHMFDYMVIHDVDTLPLSSNYNYDKNVIHLIPKFYQDNSNGTLNTYKNLVSGAVKITNDNFEKANGFSNNYWGWGEEDIDFSIRLKKAGLGMYHYKSSDNDLGEYLCLSHNRNIVKHNYDMNKTLRINEETDISDYKSEGLNTLEYDLVSSVKLNDYTIKLSVSL